MDLIQCRKFLKISMAMAGLCLSFAISPVSSAFANSNDSYYVPVTSCSFESPFYGKMTWDIYASLVDLTSDQAPLAAGLIFQSSQNSNGAKVALAGISVSFNPRTHQLTQAKFSNSAMSFDLELGPDGTSGTLILQDVNGSNLANPLPATCRSVQP